MPLVRQSSGEENHESQVRNETADTMVQILERRANELGLKVNSLQSDPLPNNSLYITPKSEFKPLLHLQRPRDLTPINKERLNLLALECSKLDKAEERSFADLWMPTETTSDESIEAIDEE